jgi:tetratricopeptide (TPR) repeat protein
MISSELDDVNSFCSDEQYSISSSSSRSKSGMRELTINNDSNLILDNVISFLNKDDNVNNITEIENIPSRSSMDINLKLEEDGFITPDEKVKELIKALTEIKYLYALKSLFENLQNDFSSQILINSLKALANPISFNNNSKECAARLELHLRTWVIVLDRICFSLIILGKDFRDKLYDSLSKFAEIHQNITQDQVIRNYNIDFLLIRLRDTLHSIHYNKIAFQELSRRVKNLLRTMLNIIPSKVAISNDNCLLMLNQLCQNLNFKYPVASYYVDWIIMLTIQHNLFIWSESKEKFISRKFSEMIFMEYLWSYLEREWINKNIFDSKTEFDVVSAKLTEELENTDSLLNEPTKNEPLILPDTLWFGLLDLAQNLIQKSIRKATYGLCYYLAIESLNKAPSDFIKFKAIEILLYLYNLNNKLFSMIEPDLEQHSQKLNEDNSEKFQILLKFIKEKCFEDFNILNGGKGKNVEHNVSKEEQKNNKNIDILDFIVVDMTCSISKEPTDQLCFLKCRHMISLNSLNRFSQNNSSKCLKCPECRKMIEDNDIRYLSLQVIYKNLYSYFFEAGFILPSIELEDTDNHQEPIGAVEVEIILNKQKKFIKEMKLNSSRLLQLMFHSKKQNPEYQNVIKEIEGKNYEQAILKCKEYIKKFPETYTMRCILAYAYRNINNYEQANLYLNEAIKLKEKNPTAYCIRGEIFFRQGQYDLAIFDLNTSISYKYKNNVFTILGNSYFLRAEKQEKHDQEKDNDYNCALTNYNIALKKNPTNYLCLKNCAYIYVNQENYLNALDMLSKLLDINQKDSLILCYYGEILNNLKRYDESMTYFTKAYNVDPENIHVIIKRAITYYILQEYDNALLDLNRVIKLDSSNNIAYYYKGITYYTMENVNHALKAFEKCIELDPNDNLAKMIIYHLRGLSDNNDLNNIPNINDNISLLFMKCKIDIKLNKYHEALSDLNRLFELDDEDISFTYLLREYSDFWSYLCDYYEININEFTELGILDYFSNYMYKGI